MFPSELGWSSPGAVCWRSNSSSVRFGLGRSFVRVVSIGVTSVLCRRNLSRRPFGEVPGTILIAVSVDVLTVDEAGIEILRRSGPALLWCGRAWRGGRMVAGWWRGRGGGLVGVEGSDLNDLRTGRARNWVLIAATLIFVIVCPSLTHPVIRN